MAALAFSGLGVEICGVESDHLGGVKVFVGPRYRGRYFLVPEPEAESVRRQWGATFCGHLIMDRRDVPYLLHEYRGGER